jgi:hypothetical protein
MFRESLDMVYEKPFPQKFMKCGFYRALFCQLFVFLSLCYGTMSHANAVHHSVHFYSRHCNLLFTRWLLIQEESTVWLCQQKEKFTHGEKVMMGNWGMATEGIFYTPDATSIWSAAVSFRYAMWQLIKKVRSYNVWHKIKSIHKGLTLLHGVVLLIKYIELLMQTCFIKGTSNEFIMK